MCIACNLPERRSSTAELSTAPARSGESTNAVAAEPDLGPVAEQPSTFRQAAWPIPQPQTSAATNPSLPYAPPQEWPPANTPPAYGPNAATGPNLQPGAATPSSPAFQSGFPPQAVANTGQGWPGDNVGVSAGPPTNIPPTSNPLTEQDASDVYDPTVTVATVGDQYILRGDLIGEANLILAPNVEKIPPEERDKQRDQILAARDKLAKQLLNQFIERKLMYLEFLRSIPEDKRAEAEAGIQERIGEAFEEDLAKMIKKVRTAGEAEYGELAREDANLFRLAMLMKQQKMATTIQLNNYLLRYGSSLEKQREAFAERALGRQALVGGIETQPEVTHVEMLEYYNRRVEEFQVPDRAKWEQLTVRFDHFNSREEAHAAISAMGNEVWLGGSNFKAVAKRSSQGPQAKQGGQHDWTEWGDLEVSREIQQVVFSIPPDQLSQIIEDVEGLHIVRVQEHSPAHLTPFSEAQPTIKKKLQGEKRSEEISQFVARLREQTPIWTIYDDEDNDAQQRIAEPSPRPNSTYPR